MVSMSSKNFFGLIKFFNKVSEDIRRQFEDFKTYFSRQKRSVDNKFIPESDSSNHTVKFYHTVDEINEDTLKDLNDTGTIQAHKVEVNKVPKISRRTSMYDNFNSSDLNALHIEYNQPQDYDHHITENKIETHNGDKVQYNEDRLNKILGNQSRSERDKVLSKIVVNELKKGSETIGDKNVSPMSNITFTPENDTLTAMTYIAGNLLNKLWNMEMESTDVSMETEALKHEKINDLLELFKEPLSMRQENFIKTALEKLSDTLSKNKNVKNISLCETITEQSSQEENTKSEMNTTCTTEKSTNVKGKRTKDAPSPTTEAISKLNHVINLIKKFENVQNMLNGLQSQTKENKPLRELFTETNINTQNDSSLKLFSNLLDKITKLLVPNKNSKKILGKLKELNQFKNNKNVKSLVGDKYKIDISERDITAKDKVILDYLDHIENNPNCLLKKNLHKIDLKPTMNVEGNILYNLSEFLKVKSFIDLVKLIKPEMSSKPEPQQRPETTTTLPETITKIIENVPMDKIQRSLNATKDKLKNHLKDLMSDLIELQNVRGMNKEQTKIKISDILPCIYNMMNGDAIINNEKAKTQTALSRIKNVLDTIKMELNSDISLPTRRNNIITETPQSAILWQRVIKNVAALQRKSRRNLGQTSEKTYEELKNIIEQVELVGNSYKNFAMLSVVPPQKQLMLLKTLEADTKVEKNALEAIINSMHTVNSLPLDKRSEINEFIDNADNNINLSVKVLKNIDKSKQKSNENPLVEVFNVDQNKRPSNEQETQNMSEMLARYKNNVKLTRDQIVKQLIIKRVEYYLKSREAMGLNLSDDVNYNIGKRILILMKTGNYNIAKELFKVFVANKRKDENVRNQSGGATIMNEQRTKGRLLMALKDPLIRFDDQVTKTHDQDQLVKQLMKFKNLS
ncbi:uncharacterized protein LOC116775354 [Danaus plexippus]|uniref:uncharacterized protein LOC116775354 n=1 Tax=Danaus plexippus TaxID=13037 RepID=UPI002AB0B7B1|nr:uncharacterized protein LOC116775354 [Danaus plexippus]